MNSLPLISIITPVYNGIKTIQRTIDSIRQQDYERIEHIVIDGGSQDGTLDMLRDYESWLTWFSEPDNGQSDAINKGLARARGDYLTWLNADDFLYPGAIRRCVQEIRENPQLGLIYGQLALVTFEGELRRIDPRIHAGTYDELLHWDNIVGQPGVLFSRAAWRTCGPLDIDCHYAMDWDLWIRIGAKFPMKFVPQPLAALAIYDTTKTATGGLERFLEILRILERHGSRAALHHYKTGLWYYSHNQLTEARHHFLISLSRNPKPVVRNQLITLILKTWLGIRIIETGRKFRARVRLR